MIRENELSHIDEHYRDQLTGELLKLWQSTISKDHHKDRDCHWTISQKFSYGEMPNKLTLEHYGYLYGDVEEEYSSLREAKVGLINHLELAIRKVSISNDQYLPSFYELDQILNKYKIERSSDINRLKF